MEALRLARSQKLQEHIWGQSGTLASATSLSVASFRGQWPESESLSWLCLWSVWTEALLETMRFLRTQIRDCRIWLDWKCNGPLPLVVLAPRRPEKALQGLLFQLLRYFFCGMCGNELEGLALIAWGQKSLLPHCPALHHLFCYHIHWSGNTWKGYLGIYVCPLMIYQFYCGQVYSQSCA